MFSPTRADRLRASRLTPAPGRRSGLAWLLALPLASLTAAPAHALDVGWLIGGGLEYSDNIGRDAEGDEEDEWVRDVRAGVVLQEETSRFEGQFDGLVLLEDYADNRFTEGVVFEGNGSADIHLVPQRLTWVVRDSFQQVPEVTRSVDTRGNEQNANAFVTGPDLELPLGALTSLRLGARYGDYYFEETDEDHTREVAQAGIARRLTATSEVSLNARTEEVAFDDESDDDEDPREDFVTDSVFARYDLRLANDGQVTLDLGGYEVERDSLGNTDGVLAEASARRGLGPNAAAGVQVEHGPTDVGSTVSAFGDDPLRADTDNVSVTGDIGEENSARAFYRHQFGRLSVNLSGGVSEEDYVVADDFDRDRSYVALGLDYRMTPRRTAFVEADRTRTDYAVDDPPADVDRDYDEYDDYEYSLGFDQRLGRALTLTTALLHDRRRAYGDGVDYEENRLRVTLVYGFGHPDVVGELPPPDEDI